LISPLINHPFDNFSATSDNQAMIQQDRSTGFDRILRIIETKPENRLSKKLLSLGGLAGHQKPTDNSGSILTQSGCFFQEKKHEQFYLQYSNHCLLR
jgi:hypothetical protein